MNNTNSKNDEKEDEEYKMITNQVMEIQRFERLAQQEEINIQKIQELDFEFQKTGRVFFTDAQCNVQKKIDFQNLPLQDLFDLVVKEYHKTKHQLDNLDSIPEYQELVRKTSLENQIKIQEKEELSEKERDLKNQLHLLQQKFHAIQQLVNQTIIEKKTSGQKFLNEQEKKIEDDEKQIIELLKEEEELKKELKRLEQENMELSLVFKQIKKCFGCKDKTEEKDK